MSVRQFVYLRSLFNFCLLTIVTLATHEPSFISLENFSILFVASFLGPYLGRHLFMASVKRIPLSISVGLNQTQPLFAALLSSFFVMKLPTNQQWVGGCLILCGCLFMVGSKGRQRRLQVRKNLNELD